MPQASFEYIRRPDYIGNALNGLIGAQEQHEQQNAQQDAYQQQTQTQQQQQRIKYLLDQYLKQPAEVQTHLYSTAPPEIKQYLVDPSLAYNTPDAQTQRQIQQQIDRNKLNVAQHFNPTGGDTSAINYDLLTNKNAPEEYLKMGYMRDYLNPNQIGTVMTAPAVKDLASASASNATAAKTSAEVPFVPPEARSKIGLQNAQAGEAGARTKKTQTETAGLQQTQQQQQTMSAPIGSSAPRLQKTQTNPAGQTRIVYSDDGGVTWHP